MENVIYLGYKNDLSFIVSGILNLYEHQSTVNPNMLLRGLLYFSRQYEAYIKHHHFNIYGRAPVKLPFPQYIIFYNGSADWTDGQDVRTLLLTDSFEETGRDDIIPCLECRATVYNINYGHNQNLMEHCRTLKGYSILISRITGYREQGYPEKQAVDEAVKSCIADGILEDFLTKHRAEVVGMLLEEFNMKEFLQMDRRDEYNAGREEGISIGEKRGKEQGRREERLLSIRVMLDAGLSKELLLEKGYSAEEIETAKSFG